jgi:uncharacterized phiE125 gp8 family phage protein
MLHLVGGPASEPVSAAEAKAFARIDGNEDDALIGTLITTARERLERYTNRALFTQTWEMVLDELKSTVQIPKPPLISVESIKYTDTAGTEFVVPPASYYVVLGGDYTGGKVVLSETLSDWPGYQYVRLQAGWRIRFVCGPDEYPEWAKHLVLEMVAWMYDNRSIDVPMSILSQADQFKRWAV